MSNSVDTKAETLENNNNNIDNQNPNHDIDTTHEFETLARSWISTLPSDKSLNPNDVQTWLQSNHSSLPDHIKSMPSSDVFQMFTSFLNDGNISNEVSTYSLSTFIIQVFLIIIIIFIMS